MPIYSNFYQTLTTACPIVELRGYAAACGLKGHLYAYLDFNGPTGTARDGLAEGMLALAAEKHKLLPGQPIIEAASGSFAMALALAGRTAGHPVVLTMPEDAPALRQEYLLRLGAQILHSPAQRGLAGARALAETTAAEKGWYYMNWLANDDNPEYHRRVTGPAIVQSIARQALHCARQSFAVPVYTPLPDGIRVEMPLQLRTVTVESPLPPDMEALFS